jgi:rhomboid protease GluP
MPPAVTEDAIQTGPVRDRLVSALADPEIADKLGVTPAALVACQEAMVVFEWLGAGKGLVLLDHDKIPDLDFRAQLGRILGSHERGLLFVAAIGASPDIAETLRAADAETRNRDHVGLYLVDPSGKVQHIAGRRLGELEKAGRALPSGRSLSDDDIAAIVERGRRERIEAMEFVRGSKRRLPHITLAILAACVLLYALTTGNDPRGQRLYELFINNPVAVRHGEIWRLLTYALLHDRRTLTHLLVNMLSLYSLGAFLEPLLGRYRLGLLCLVTTVAGGLASTLFTHAPSVGASGMVWGLVGATFGLLRGRHRFFPALIARSLRQRLFVILLLNVGISFLPGIDRYCHFGGGIAGYVLALAFARGPMRSRT